MVANLNFNFVCFELVNCSLLDMVGLRRCANWVKVNSANATNRGAGFRGHQNYQPFTSSTLTLRFYRPKHFA